MTIKHILAYLFAAVLFFAVTAPDNAAAFIIRNGNHVSVPKGETINETLLAAGQSIVVDGDVKGDIICAGQNIDINGAVEGDIICAGQNVTIANNVGGSVRCAGQTVKINGAVGRNVTAAGQTISTSSTIAGEMLFAGQQANINGKIAKNIAGASNSIFINANIGGNADFRDKDLILQKDGRIAGALTYASANELTNQGGQVLGSVNRTIPAAKENTIPFRTQKTVSQKIADKVIGFLINLAVALMLVFLFKGFTFKAVDAILAKPGRTFGWGLLILIAVPIAAIVLAITIIGIPVALLAVALYVAAIFLSRIISAIAVGKKITQTYWKSKQNSPMVQALVGVAALWILFAIPVIGGLLSFVAAIWGLGGMRYLFGRNKDIINNQTI